MKAAKNQQQYDVTPKALTVRERFDRIMWRLYQREPFRGSRIFRRWRRNDLLRHDKFFKGLTPLIVQELERDAALERRLAERLGE